MASAVHSRTNEERAALLSDLAHVRALFQARAIAAVIGAPMPVGREVRR